MKSQCNKDIKKKQGRDRSFCRTNQINEIGRETRKALGLIKYKIESNFGFSLCYQLIGITTAALFLRLFGGN